MKYIKTFENINEPQIGDYVVCEEEYQRYSSGNFARENVGEIIDTSENGYYYIIKYENVPENLKDELYFKDLDSDKEYSDVIPMNRNEIKFFSPSKEYAESYISSKKYNL
jgi:hypothetical protein